MTYGGCETTLIYEEDVELPDFCAFDAVMKTPEKVSKVQGPYVELAAERGIPIIMDAATWRASKDYADKLNYDLGEVVEACVDQQRILKEQVEKKTGKRVLALLSAEIGPRGDGYVLDTAMTAEEAEEYHSSQIRCLKNCKVDMAQALTMLYPEECIGIAAAAKKCDLPITVSCTVETDGKLPCGISVREFVETVDSATDAYPLCYMVNCAHPTHCESIFQSSRDEAWFKRVRGFRANASDKSHEELEKMTELDAGDPKEFGSQVSSCAKAFDFCIVGGCCGTNHVHVKAVLDNIMPSTSNTP